ncbi:S8 family serine peptidase [Oceanicaulis sp. MMSF_3324]|uniref:S8 family peptidase n=1 Tax=Oceanicaulis sp. MMSF_3324 TaxID=3046702 RepID=UPI00273FE94D|nr:S8 family serine peptidase [Oceanicaulis sp. MMSF_3324]
MRVSTLLFIATMLGSQLLGAANASQSESVPADLESAMSAPLSERALNSARSGERIGVIVMLHDDPYQRDLRSVPDIRGEAALASFEARIEQIISEATEPQRFLSSTESEQSNSASHYAQFPLSAGFALRATPAQIVNLASHPDVSYVFEDALNAPQLDQTTHRIGAWQAWGQGFEGRSSTVAVLDTGVDAYHVMFRDAIKASACFSSAVAGESASLCENGEARQTSLTSATLALPCLDKAADPENGTEGCFHGTHVASIAVGRSFREHSRVQGVAPEAKLVAVQVFSRFNEEVCADYYPGREGECVLSPISRQIEALEWLYSVKDELGLTAINMSLGGGEFAQPCMDDPRRSIIQSLAQAGVFTVVASGNDSFSNALSAPACIPEVLSVGSTGSGMTPSGFSNHSEYLDFYAPGDAITAAAFTEAPSESGECASSTVGAYVGTYPDIRYLCSRLLHMSGTSMAAPHLTGALAIIRDAVPEASFDEILDALRFTARRPPRALEHVPAGEISINKAISYLQEGGVIVGGVILIRPRTYVARNASHERDSFNTETYRFYENYYSSRSLHVLSHPEWVSISDASYPRAEHSDTFFLDLERPLDLVFSVNIQEELADGLTGVVRLSPEHSDEVIEIPVSLNIDGELDRIRKVVTAGPWSMVGDSENPESSIFRIVGLDRSMPHRINVAIAGAASGDYQYAFTDCSLPIRPERYSGSEYLIIRSDLGVCGEFGRATLRFQILADPEDVDAGLRMRRFFLDREGALTDAGYDRFNNIQVSESQIREAVPASLEATVDQPQSFEDSRILEWIGSSSVGAITEYFVYQGLAVDTRVQYVLVGFYFESQPGQSPSGYRQCELPYIPERRRGGEYVVRVSDLEAYCDFRGRADISLSFVLGSETSQSLSPTRVSRIVQSPDGGITDFYNFRYAGIDNPAVPTLKTNRETGERYLQSTWGVFGWTGDANAPTQSVFRIAGIRGGAPRTIDVSIAGSLRGDYQGDFSDCRLDINPARATDWDYLIFAEDLEVCGDFGRADLTFRFTMGRTEVSESSGYGVAPGRVYMRRLAVGAEGDLTNFSFDMYRYRGVKSRSTRADGRLEVTSEVFEWVGDVNQGTRSIFRLSGVTDIPDEIHVALDHASAESGRYAGEFTDCVLQPRPERLDGDAYLILPQDIAECGAFVRADLQFQFLLLSGSHEERPTLRRFAVTNTGGLTDFVSDIYRHD